MELIPILQLADVTGGDLLRPTPLTALQVGMRAAKRLGYLTARLNEHYATKEGQPRRLLAQIDAANSRVERLLNWGKTHL